MKIRITEEQAKKLYPEAFKRIPDSWKSGSILSFFVEGENLSMRSDDGLRWEWTIYRRWIRLT
jgi:hypothetical protein